MATSLKATIVIINFPFSDLSGTKKRPALVVADWGGEDVILAQITSITNKDAYAIELKNDDIVNGSLMKTSFIRANKLFTADKRIFLQQAGRLTDKKLTEVTDKIHSLFNAMA